MLFPRFARIRLNHRCGLHASVHWYLQAKHKSQPQHTDEMRSGALSLDCGRESSLSSVSTFTTDSLENKLSSANSKDHSSRGYAYSERTDVSVMQVKSVYSSDIRVSVSSALCTSSHGSGGEDSESFGEKSCVTPLQYQRLMETHSPLVQLPIFLCQSP
ncbi:hypothetical protein VPH35_041422 [Triticum aestivum]|uniref:Uncharacterized protein n=2 Tax=Aegilops tauschii subsp. strangulata TaxID=200361 RepID=A0A453DJD7_AEGTS